MIITEKKGFTLIEILIVVAIIAILASIVLVGLGPTQQSGRDARRLSDLHEVQNVVELYYNECGFYPSVAAAAGVCPTASNINTYADMTAAITGTPATGANSLPNDPTSGKTYFYESYGTTATSYVLGATLENANNSVYNGYTWNGNIPNGMTSCLQAASEYCVTL
jgi:prepilin-type N-terminal cleavage/methylation domain-containing protein